MINVLFPLGGKDTLGDNSPYPKWLVEVGGKPMIEIAVRNYQAIKTQEINFVFCINKSDCIKFHLDNILNIITDNKCYIVRLEQETAGAACSSLMAIKNINNENPLIIANYDQVFNDNIIDKAIYFFIKNDADAGVICFETIHPRWSYIRTDDNDKIIEAAEKRPLSKFGIAGFYYFKKGIYFVEAAKKSIMKNSMVDGKFYIAPVLNELILKNRRLLKYNVDGKQYRSFFILEKIKEYNDSIFNKGGNDL